MINEPLIGAHRQKEEAINAFKRVFLESLAELNQLTLNKEQKKNIQKSWLLGSFQEGK